MRVQLIDPSGDVAPYDHALAAALGGAGADVELVTSRFVHGPAADPRGVLRGPTLLPAGHPLRRRARRGCAGR